MSAGSIGLRVLSTLTFDSDADSLDFLEGSRGNLVLENSFCCKASGSSHSSSAVDK